MQFEETTILPTVPFPTDEEIQAMDTRVDRNAAYAVRSDYKKAFEKASVRRKRVFAPGNRDAIRATREEAAAETARRDRVRRHLEDKERLDKEEEVRLRADGLTDPTAYAKRDRGVTETVPRRLRPRYPKQAADLRPLWQWWPEVTHRSADQVVTELLPELAAKMLDGLQSVSYHMRPARIPEDRLYILKCSVVPDRRQLDPSKKDYFKPKALLPTHALGVKQPGGTLYSVYPIHDLLFASKCSNFHTPDGFPREADHGVYRKELGEGTGLYRDYIDLLIVRTEVYNVRVFEHMYWYLYRQDIATLLKNVLPPLPRELFDYLVSSTPLKDSWADLGPPESSFGSQPRPELTPRQRKLQEDLTKLAQILANTYPIRRLVVGLFDPLGLFEVARQFGVRDIGLWNVVTLSWVIIMRAIAISSEIDRANPPEEVISTALPVAPCIDESHDTSNPTVIRQDPQDFEDIYNAMNPRGYHLSDFDAGTIILPHPI